MTLIKRLIGLLMVVGGLLGLALSVGGVLYGNQGIDQLGQQLLVPLDTTNQSLQTTVDALIVAKNTVQDVNNTLETVEETAGDLAQTITDTTPLLDEVTAIVTVDVPNSLATVQETLPNVASVAGTVDDTLSTLSSFQFEQTVFGIPVGFDLGLNYDPTVRFDDSITTVAASLDGLPERLQEVEPQLTITKNNIQLMSANVDQLAADLQAINTSIANIIPVLDQYVTILTSVQDNVSTIRGQLPQYLETAKTVVLLLALWFALIQLVPLYLGYELIVGKRKEVIIEQAPPPAPAASA